MLHFSAFCQPMSQPNLFKDDIFLSMPKKKVYYILLLLNMLQLSVTSLRTRALFKSSRQLLIVNLCVKINHT